MFDDMCKIPVVDAIITGWVSQSSSEKKESQECL